jgi:hypothetical protein
MKVETGEKTHKSDQCSPERTYLLDDTLCCAIGPRPDLPVVSPSDKEDTPHSMNDIEHQNGELPQDQSRIRWRHKHRVRPL